MTLKRVSRYTVVDAYVIPPFLSVKCRWQLIAKSPEQSKEEMASNLSSMSVLTFIKLVVTNMILRCSFILNTLSMPLSSPYLSSSRLFSKLHHPVSFSTENLVRSVTYTGSVIYIERRVDKNLWSIYIVVDLSSTFSSLQNLSELADPTVSAGTKLLQESTDLGRETIDRVALHTDLTAPLHRRSLYIIS